MGKRIIRVQGYGSAESFPDLVIIKFELESTSYDYTDCAMELAQKVATLQKDLAAVDIKSEGLKTLEFSISPKFEWVKGSHVFTGYSARQRLRVEFAYNKELLNKVLTKLACSASNSRFNIEFSVKEFEFFRRKAIEKAVETAKENAAILAEAADVRLGQIMNISYGWDEVRIISNSDCNYVAEADSSVALDINPEEVKAQESVVIEWEIE